MALTRHRDGITESEAAVYADRFEAMGPDDFGTPVPGPAAFAGRRSLSGAGKTPRVTLRLPDPLLRRYRRRALRDGRSMSALLREILVRHAPRS